MIELEHADGDSFEPIPTPEIEPDAGIVAGEEAAFRLRLLETKIYRSHLRSLRNSWCLFAALKLAADTWRAVHGAAALSSRHPRIYRPLCGAPHNAEFELLSGRAPEGSDRAKARGVEMGRKPKL